MRRRLEMRFKVQCYNVSCPNVPCRNNVLSPCVNVPCHNVQSCNVTRCNVPCPNVPCRNEDLSRVLMSLVVMSRVAMSHVVMFDVVMTRVAMFHVVMSRVFIFPCHDVSCCHAPSRNVPVLRYPVFSQFACRYVPCRNDVLNCLVTSRIALLQAVISRLKPVSFHNDPYPALYCYVPQRPTL